MSALYRNDQRGAHPNSWYAASADIPPLHPPLRGQSQADLCIVGAGYAGLSAALEARAQGLSVIVLEAHRPGFGASGRNGGQISSGYNKDMRWLERAQGPDAARHLWDLAEAAKSLTKSQIATHAPDAMFTPGVAFGGWTADDTASAQREADHLHSTYGYDQIRTLDRAAFGDLVKSPVYRGGTLDLGAGHVHPLRYVLGLARGAQAAGAVLHDLSPVHHLRPNAGGCLVQTDAGQVQARHVLLAGNGYLPNLNRRIAARTMPINSFIAATTPLPDPTAILRDPIAVADAKFVVNYFRLSHDNRLLFGGAESYGIGFPRKIEPRIRARMAQIFPQLAGVELSHIWGGTLGITMSRLPLLWRNGPVLSVGGFSGHGVALSALSGQMAARAIAGDTQGFDTLSALPTSPFPGGALLRAPLLMAAMTWYSLRDRLGI